MIEPGWILPRSPFGLIQEDLWSHRPEAEWMILVSCMLLNQTSRKQVEKVLPEFQRRWPGPKQFLDGSIVEVVELCRPLGFANRRTVQMVKMTQSYLEGGWIHARELPGIGEYGARAWEIFCQGIIGDEPPDDHALTDYWRWYKQLPALSVWPPQSG